MPNRKVSDVFQAVNDRQKVARFGLEDMKNPQRTRSGLYNAVVFGRMVTFALQNLRSVVEGFDVWYGPKKEEMKTDPLMNYFHELRTDIEKRTEAHTAVSAHIKSLSGGDLKRFQPAPPGATSFFIGDQNGGSGWELKRADGTVEKYYIDLPPDIGEVAVHLPKRLSHIGICRRLSWSPNTCATLTRWSPKPRRYFSRMMFRGRPASQREARLRGHRVEGLGSL